MDRTPDEIEASLNVPDELADAVYAHTESQDGNRGDWASPRDARMPEPPWPDEDNPMLRFLLHKAMASVDAGMEPRAAMLQLAVHAWFEGGVANYDRGQRDARRPRAV